MGSHGAKGQGRWAVMGAKPPYPLTWDKKRTVRKASLSGGSRVGKTGEYLLTGKLICGSTSASGLPLFENLMQKLHKYKWKILEKFW